MKPQKSNEWPPPPPALRLYGSPVLDAMMDENLSQESSTGKADDFLRVGDEVIGQLIKTMEESNVRDPEEWDEGSSSSDDDGGTPDPPELGEINGFSASLQHVKNGGKSLPILT